MSTKSIQEAIARLQRVEIRTKENIRLATEDLMYATYNLLCNILKENNLSNHIGSIQVEITDGGFGFRIWTNDWIIIFHEYGTGIVGSNSPHPNPTISWVYDKNGHGEKGWKYRKKDGTYGWTRGLPSKHIFYDVEQEIKKYAKDFYQTAINLAITDEQYQSFKNSLRG